MEKTFFSLSQSQLLQGPEPTEKGRSDLFMSGITPEVPTKGWLPLVQRRNKLGPNQCEKPSAWHIPTLSEYCRRMDK